MRQDRKSREQQFAEMAKDSFKDHLILQASEEPYPRWLVGRPNGSSVYKAEVIMTYDRSLIVHGDIDIVNFYGYSERQGRGIVEWVAKSGADYLASKASRGTGVEVAWCYDPEVAYDDALSYAEEGEKNPEDYRGFLDEDGVEESWSQRWMRVAGIIEHGASQEEAAAAVYDLIEDSEYCDIGKCVAPRVLWAKALVLKLHELLEEQDPQQGKTDGTS